MECELTKKQREVKEALTQLGTYVIRPMSLQMDRDHLVPETFLKQFVAMTKSVRNDEDINAAFGEGKREPPSVEKPMHVNRTPMVRAEHLPWPAPAVLLSLP